MVDRLSAEQWARAQEIFLAVLDIPPQERIESARSLCGDSATVFTAVERLLAGHEDPHGVLGPPSNSWPPMS